MSVDTKDQILDAAERLFAVHGIDAVSLRTITHEAGVNLAAVNYHFGSKEMLVTQVFMRRIGEVNRERLRLLTEYEQRAGEGPLVVEEVLNAFMRPAIYLSRDAEHGDMVMQLCGRVYTESQEYMDSVVEDLFREVVQRFGVAFQRALPDLPFREISWRAHFAVGTMVHTIRDGSKLVRLSKGLCDPSDAERVIERMVQFAAAGMRAPLLPQFAEQQAAPMEAEVSS
jgi:AcrR family transcriptional regulator